METTIKRILSFIGYFIVALLGIYFAGGTVTEIYFVTIGFLAGATSLFFSQTFFKN